MKVWTDSSPLEFRKGDLIFLQRAGRWFKLVADDYHGISWLTFDRKLDDVFPCPKHPECSACGEVHRP